ncbi:MAG: DUF3859 domain-containing protein [Psychromonas sp.]|nr:DUF3859 domain-containing protein [Psychromonas sp.]
MFIYLGDTIWTPIGDKCATWQMTIKLNTQIVADKIFNISSANLNMHFKKPFAYS